jgi:peptidoglycan/xylan/chitin deacetylase (PgdA/CDA1 family)
MTQETNISSPLYPLLLIGLVVVLSLVITKSPQNLKLPWFKIQENKNASTPLPPKAPLKAKIPILLYHYVELVEDKKDFLRARLAVSPQNFENQLVSLKKSGYTFYYVKDIGRLLETEVNSKPVIISFDDGYGDFYTDAFPIIKRQNVKATVFINSGLMGQPNYMTPQQVTEVANSGLVEIGGHGFSHQNLTNIATESAKKVIDDDVTNIKKSYGITPVSFAYPYGTYNETIRKMVSDAGYKYAATLESGWIVQNSALLELPRIRPGLAGNSDLGVFLDSLK